MSSWSGPDLVRAQSRSAFAFGRCFGLVTGALAALTIPVTLIAPAAWKRTIGIRPGKDGAKDAARSEAIRRWPDKAALRSLSRKRRRPSRSVLDRVGGTATGAGDNERLDVPY